MQDGRATFTRRSVLFMAASSVGLALATACASQSAPPAQPQPPAPQAQSAQTAQPPGAPNAESTAAKAKPGGTLRVAQLGDINTIDGHVSGVNVDTIWQVYDRLAVYDDKYQPQPSLAESWEMNPDGRQLKMNLRKGVTFHNGRELTSDDVKWNVLRVRDPKVGAASLGQQSNWFTDVATPDKATIVFSLERARPGLFDFFEFLNILDKATIEGPNAKSSAVGTGPFVLSEWQQGASLRLTRNKNYWRTGRPYVDEVRVRVIPAAQGMVTQLEAGSVDLVGRAPIREIVRLKEDPKYASIINPSAVNLVNINTKFPPMSNKLIRQAINYALDRKRFVTSVYSGLSEPRAVIWAPGSPAYDPTKANAYPFDLARAKSLLSEAGSSGFEMEMIWNAGNADLKDLAELYQADLATIGITTTLKPMEGSSYLPYANDLKFQGINLTTAPGVDLSPGKVLELKNLAPSGVGHGFTDPRYSAMVDAVQTETDPAKQKQLYAEVTDYLLDQCFVIPIATNVSLNALFSSKVQGVRHNKNTGLNYTDTWLE